MIGVWSTELELQRAIEMENNSESERTSSKRHVKMWITDAVTMPNVHKMAISSTNRDIYFYDMSTPKYTPQFHLCGENNCYQYKCDVVLISMLTEELSMKGVSVFNKQKLNTIY